MIKNIKILLIFLLSSVSFILAQDAPEDFEYNQSRFQAFYLFLEGNIAGVPLDEIRPVTDQPLFFIALVSIIIGVQLFLAGFLAEIVVKVSSKNDDQIVSDKKGFD